MRRLQFAGLDMVGSDSKNYPNNSRALRMYLALLKFLRKSDVANANYINENYSIFTKLHRVIDLC